MADTKSIPSFSTKNIKSNNVRSENETLYWDTKQRGYLLIRTRKEGHAMRRGTNAQTSRNIFGRKSIHKMISHFIYLYKYRIIFCWVFLPCDILLFIGKPLCVWMAVLTTGWASAWSTSANTFVRCWRRNRGEERAPWECHSCFRINCNSQTNFV